jgi:hypothetical protein
VKGKLRAVSNPFYDPPFLSEDDRARVWVHASPAVREAFDKIETLEHEIENWAQKNPGVVVDRKDILAATKALQLQINKEMAAH